MLRLILLVVPLGFDTFAISAGLGTGGLSAAERLRVSLVMTTFETAMPIIGLLIGDGVGGIVRGVADYVAGAALVALGAWTLVGDVDGIGAKRVGPRGGLALIALGISVSLDELAMGFTIGLLRLDVPIAVALIGVQALAVTQLGLRLSGRLGQASPEWAARLAGIALLGLGVWVVGEKLG